MPAEEEKKVTKSEDYKTKYSRVLCENLLKRQFFFTQSFDIYGGVAGFYDYGPLGSSLKANLEAMWRNHFILEEDMLELTCTCMTLGDVLQTSGHVAKFADFMVKDLKTGQCHRADKLINEAIEKILSKKKLKPEEIERLQKIQQDCDNYNAEEMTACIRQNGFKAPDTGNELSDAVPFNLMFASDIGPTGQLHGYLRPETAQGIFLNFRKLIEYNNDKMPFACAQIGLGFRNEIHPKQGLLRVREFQMAEIEHFCDPQNKDYPKFHLVADHKLPLLTAQNQEGSGEIIYDMTLQQAVESKTINNQTLAYYMARTYSFLQSVGIKKEAIRFRQHRCNEMAHYAQDCWDAEVECSYGWIEVAGQADRSCYDLQRHSERTKVELQAARPLKEPMKLKFVRIAPNRQVIGKTYKKDSKAILDLLENADEELKEKLMKEMEEHNQITLKIEDQEVKLNAEAVTLERQEKTVLEEKYIPHVIEPSYGLGRIIYCVFEHCFKMREQDQQRTYFDFPAAIAPFKCSILPLVSKTPLIQKTQELKTLLTRAGLPAKVDDSSGTVGKRYARTDEQGIPFAFTVDFETLENQTVTMRELDSMNQIRLPIADTVQVLQSLVNGTWKWAQLVEKYGLIKN